MKLYFVLLTIIPVSVYANDLLLTYYDPSFYDQTGAFGPAEVVAGGLTAISDIYYYFKPFEKTLVITQSEWLSDGNGDEYIAPYDSVLNYSNITFENIKEYNRLSYDYYFMNTILPQWKRETAKEVIATYSNHYATLALASNQMIKIQNIQMTNLAFEHDNIQIGRNAGDANKSIYIWGGGIYNHGKQRGTNNFSTDTISTIIGSELSITNSFSLGVGYQFIDTDLNIKNRNSSHNNNSVFVYNKYNKQRFFVNSIFAYNFGDYEYIDSIYNGKNNGYFASLILGTKTQKYFTPEIGIRYSHTEIKDKYELPATLKSNILTSVVGLKYEDNINKILIGGKVFIDCDIYKPDTNIDNMYISILNQYFNTTQKHHDKNIGTELGAWIKYDIENINIRAEYDLFLQTNYINHSGKISVGYKF